LVYVGEANAARHDRRATEAEDGAVEPEPSANEDNGELPDPEQHGYMDKRSGVGDREERRDDKVDQPAIGGLRVHPAGGAAGGQSAAAVHHRAAGELREGAEGDHGHRAARGAEPGVQDAAGAHPRALPAAVRSDAPRLQPQPLWKLPQPDPLPPQHADVHSNEHDQSHAGAASE